ncbi:amino acid adenylation domain-containing protein [Lyngbya sp. CCAP 1446/10]|uniref:non-ribosomal peptide synthetase n=1 Tax=Lyngbya sp. CCAP 1446/10 TaxID=439293 RepID=UPI002238D32A|nr:amino acid adenylation domain-containing protein [Lyngbya sp. CCAP 1446/10]MCW6050897.1 amino acid adenylation domain-containing protein [Lyngbya sp. CCAP 1446/10]
MDINKRQILARRYQLSPSKQALLAKRLRGEIQSDSPINLIPRRDITDSAPLSFPQQRLWLLQQIDRTNPSYNEHGAIQLKGLLNVPALERSLNEIVQRHESLRTTFKMREGQPVQIISPSLTIKLPTVNLSDLPLSEQNNQIQQLTLEQSQSPFDLSQGPLLRWTLLQIGQQDYVLLVTMHHIICDGWSYGVMMRELAALYEAFSNSKASPLSELPIQYADFALWQQHSLKGEVLETVLEKQIVYWKQQLGNTPPVLQLPADYPRPAVQTFRGARKTFSLTAELTKALKALSQNEDATFFMTLLAAFKILLYRYTGIEDVAIGSPIANRNMSEIEQLIGCFVNTLVLRTDLSGNPTFRELLSRVRQVCVGAYAHCDVPFEKLVETLQPQRSLSYTPLFQVMFTLLNTPTSVLELSGLTVSSLESNNGTAKFDLSLYIEERGEESIATIEYNTDLFEAATIARMSEHFQHLLAGIVANPDRRVNELPLLTSSEKQQLLDWNCTQTDYPKDACIHQLFEAQVEKTPDAVAIVFEDRQLTYQELNQQADRLADYLRELGVRSEVLVGICVERSIEMVVGLLGILKAGGAYVPLDPAYPQERLNFILSDAQVSVLLTRKTLIKELPTLSANVTPVVVYFDREWDTISNPKSKIQNPKLSDSLAYVLYTSGSTGTPKGVLGRHRSAVNRLNWNPYPFEQGEICCQKTSLNFIDSVWEIFAPLLHGLRTVIIADEIVKDPYQLVKTLSQQQVTRLVLVPSLLRVLLETFPDLQSRLPKLKYWVSSGETLSVELCQRFQERMPQSVLINLYGSSEVSADVTWYDTSKNQSLSSIAIGRPISNMQVYVLDAHLQPVPIGVPGELCIGGDGLARGYLNRPELTAEKFIPNPFISENGAYLYRSGDIGRYRFNGEIEYLGRSDSQIKLRGFRIELGEIENVLNQHPAVKQAVVLLREDEVDNKRLVAYIVSDNINLELRSFVAEKLPDYMVPSVVVQLEALPLIPNGKVDYRALPVPENRRDLKRDYAMPKTEAERLIAEVWQEILQLEKVGINDNFFEIGGHSLLLVKVQAKLHKVLERNISAIDLFKYPSIKMLAEYLSRKQDGEQPIFREVNSQVRKQAEAVARQKELFKQARNR